MRAVDRSKKIIIKLIIHSFLHHTSVQCDMWSIADLLQLTFGSRNLTPVACSFFTNETRTSGFVEETGLRWRNLGRLVGQRYLEVR